MEKHPVSILEIRHAHTEDRWAKAIDVAKAMGAGACDDETLAAYTARYFDSTNKRSTREIAEDATLNWANWTGEQGWATIDFINLELERPAFMRMKTLFNTQAQPMPVDAFKIRPHIVERLSEDFLAIQEALKPINGGREDLQEAFEKAMAGNSDAIAEISTIEAAKKFEIDRIERSSRAYTNMTEAVTAANECGMTEAWLLNQARQNLRGIVPYKPKLALRDLRKQGRASRTDIASCRFHLQSNVRLIERHNALYESLGTGSRGAPRAQSRIELN